MTAVAEAFIARRCGSRRQGDVPKGKGYYCNRLEKLHFGVIEVFDTQFSFDNQKSMIKNQQQQNHYEADGSIRTCRLTSGMRTGFSDRFIEVPWHVLSFACRINPLHTLAAHCEHGSRRLASAALGKVFGRSPVAALVVERSQVEYLQRQPLPSHLNSLKQCPPILVNPSKPIQRTERLHALFTCQINPGVNVKAMRRHHADGDALDDLDAATVIPVFFSLSWS